QTTPHRRSLSLILTAEYAPRHSIQMFSLLLVNPPFPLSLLCASEVANTPRSVIRKKGHMVYLGRTIKFPFPDDMTWFRNPSAVNIDVYLNRKVVVQMCHMCTTRNGYCSQHTWFISHK